MPQPGARAVGRGEGRGRCQRNQWSQPRRRDWGCLFPWLLHPSPYLAEAPANLVPSLSWYTSTCLYKAWSRVGTWYLSMEDAAQPWLQGLPQPVQAPWEGCLPGRKHTPGRQSRVKELALPSCPEPKSGPAPCKSMSTQRP